MSENPAPSPKKTYPVEVVGVAGVFSCPEGQELLKAMVSRGYRAIPSGCHGGGCGICKIKILEGEVRAQHMSRDRVSVEEEKQGFSLACKAIPLSPLKVEVVGGMKRVAPRENG